MVILAELLYGVHLSVKDFRRVKGLKHENWME